MSTKLWLLAVGVVTFFLGVLLGVQPQSAPAVMAACSSLPGGGFTWTINNVPHEATQTGDPGTRLQWDITDTGFVGALVKAKYETTEANAIWYCAKITAAGVLANCANPTTDPPFPAGVLTRVAANQNDPSTSPCSQVDADGTCIAEVQYVLNFAKFDGPGITARTLAQTYYWADNSALPDANDLGDCQGDQEYRYANSGPIYGDPCSAATQADCYPVLFEEAP